MSQEENVALTIYCTPNHGRTFEPADYIGRSVDTNPNVAKQLGGYAIVSQENKLVFKNSNKGYYDGALEGVTELLDPTTISFKFLDNETAQILEQSYQFDLISSQKILDYYVNNQIEMYLPVKGPVTQPSGPIRGVLLGHEGGSGSVMIRGENGEIKILPRYEAAFNLATLPPALRTKPTLELKMTDENQEPLTKTNLIRTTYKSIGITWRADYNLVLSEDETTASLGAWVSILNMTGKTFTDAKLKLIAGDVNQVQQNFNPAPRMMMCRGSAMAAPGLASGFQEKQLFEYHMYTLPRPTTVNNASLNQLTLFPTANNIQVKKELVFQPTQHACWGNAPYTGPDQYPTNPDNQKIPVFIKFENKLVNKLGIPMPKGKVRVFKEDGDCAEFIGEDIIDHTPRNETVRLTLGHAFDVKGIRNVTNFTYDQSSMGKLRETVTIEIRNQKETSAEVIVKDIMYRWMNYELTSCVPAFQKNHGNGLVEWLVVVPPEGKTTVTYTVVYTV